ncbi:MAG TPA: DEAD/DEAH box helicase, partial [Blastocatellia bacterium]
MLILHAAFPHGKFLLWGESALDPGADHSEDRSSGKHRKAGRTRPLIERLPYDAGHEKLLGAASAVASFSEDGALAETAIVWIPSIEGLPIASSPLIDEQVTYATDAASAPDLKPWRIEVLALPISVAFDLLCSCVGKEILSPGIVIGKDLAFWTAAMRMAGVIVGRQQFLPAIDASSEPARTRWTPVLGPADSRRIAQLERSMPHSCRALAPATIEAKPTPNFEPPNVPAGSLLAAFVGEVVDYMVRSSLRAGAKRQKGRAKALAAFESVHDHWLAALRAESPHLGGNHADFRTLADQVREWERPISIGTATPFRLCFRLEEPPEIQQTSAVLEPVPPGHAQDAVQNSIVGQGQTSAPWHLQYLLQATDDPSLLIPVAEAWKGGGPHAGLLKRDAFNPRQYLLSSLGQAARTSPGIETSLKKHAPDGYDLDNTGAFGFLSEQAWLLEQSGFGVLLPAWWTRKGTKLRLSARAKVKSPVLQGGAGISLDDIIKFDWEVVVGDQTLSIKELETLAAMKSPLVRLRGQWVQLNSEEIEAALAFWRKRGTGLASARDIVRMALGASSAPGGLPMADVVASGWIGDLLGQLQGGRPFEEQPVVEEFQGVLRPYQVRGYSWLAFLKKWGLGACLADDMGLGKTPQSLALIQRDWLENRKHPTLIVCPVSVVGNWQKEAARFTPELPVMIHQGLGRTKGAAFKKTASKHALVLSSFSLLHRDLEIFKQVEWAGVILDEAQNIKNAQAKQAQAARSLTAGYRIALTGTPVENNVGDLWSIMEFLNPGLLGTQAEFKRTFFLPIQSNRDPSAAQRLKCLTGPFILRRLKTDKSIITDLPDKMEMKVFCTLTKEQASLYAAVVDDVTRELEKSDGIQRKGIVLATLSKLKQVCNHPAQFLGDNSAIPGRSGKLARLTEMLEEALAESDRALVFTQFAEMGEIIRRHLQETFGREVLFLHGGVPKKRRDSMVARFQEDGNGPPIFILSLKAGGTGLNLTRANHVFHFDRWWNPAVENQATDRAFRIGQRRNVQVHKFLCAGTLEEKIDEMIERKQELASKIVGSGEAWLTELSTSQLKELFAL